MKKDSMLYVVLFTFAVCAVFTLALAIANEGTKDLVAANAEFATQSAVLGALGVPFDGKADAAARFAETVGAGEAPRSWLATVGGADYVAVEQSGPGLWGTIVVILAATPDGERIRGVRVVSQNETPGLGGRIAEPWFLGQYEGERSPGGRVGMRAGAESSGAADSDKENGRVDGVSGATRTSQSFAAIVDAALARVKESGGER
ncbi:MAG TPA: FMN-binding protein [Spirochaetales bacterium]|nr:FMN-binding protein [Spirochaetales bacterium]HPB65963.1 FMN-binding protein [Spirochaetales bacterium]HPG86356.1 FMN-binding protein [Spirochaetales bacterium]HPM71884.1 FMN-binding protein [Spirochaetales bacterium]